MPSTIHFPSTLLWLSNLILLLLNMIISILGAQITCRCCWFLFQVDICLPNKCQAFIVRALTFFLLVELNFIDCMMFVSINTLVVRLFYHLCNITRCPSFYFELYHNFCPLLKLNDVHKINSYNTLLYFKDSWYKY